MKFWKVEKVGLVGLLTHIFNVLPYRTHSVSLPIGHIVCPIGDAPYRTHSVSHIIIKDLIYIQPPYNPPTKIKTKKCRI